MTRQRAENGTIILFGINKGYKEIFDNMICRLKHLRIDNYVIVAFDDEIFHICQLEVYPCVATYEDQDSIINLADAAQFGSDQFKQLTKLKSKYVLEALKLGINVLWSDVDIFWFSSPIPKLSQYFNDFDLLIQSNALEQETEDNGYRRVNSGFYYVHSRANTIAAFTSIVAHAAQSKLTEQPSFYSVLCGDNREYTNGLHQCHNPNYPLKTLFLDRYQYLNGNSAIWDRIYYPKSYPKNLIIAHNNWIEGLEEKIQRFKDTGLWTLESDGNCQLNSDWPIPRKRHEKKAHFSINFFTLLSWIIIMVILFSALFLFRLSYTNIRMEIIDSSIVKLFFVTSRLFPKDLQRSFFDILGYSMTRESTKISGIGSGTGDDDFWKKKKGSDPNLLESSSSLKSAPIK